ncbi:MAG: DUF4326 domain-containing protein [Bradyrhizobium sp.]|nr:DUF4326 domain-containing protein [Bradyrhizobium sp.]
MSEPRVWHINDSSRPADAVYIGRAMPRYGLECSCYGNPYRVGKDRTRDQAIDDFESMVCTHVLPRDPHWLDPLVGHDLVCWCAAKGHPLTADDPLVCHGQVLLQLIREREVRV